MLSSEVDAARYWSCHCIVALSHKHRRNQSIMAHHPGLMQALVRVLFVGTTWSKGAACSALVESTFRNAEIALLVAKTPGLMQGVVAVMQTSQGDVMDDAAGVLRNCSNYSREAAEVIVQTPGVLEALIHMCKGHHNADRFTAMGTIQNLTRCASVLPHLRATRLVHDALVPALHAMGTGEEHEVMRAEALMALTNLSSHSELDALDADPSVLAVLTQMLLCAAHGQAWREVAWYDADECLRPLSALTDNKANRTRLVELGLVPVLGQILSAWLALRSVYPMLPTAAATAAHQAGPPAAHSAPDALADSWTTDLSDSSDNWAESVVTGDEGWGTLAGVPVTVGYESLAATPGEGDSFLELGLALEALCGLGRDLLARRAMRHWRLPPLLRAVAACAYMSPSHPADAPGQPGLSESMWTERGEQGWILDARHLAVAMGQHHRLQLGHRSTSYVAT